MTRPQLINLIRTAAAENDREKLTDLYCDNRISRAAFNEAVREGRQFGSFIRNRDAAEAAEKGRP